MQKPTPYRFVVTKTPTRAKSVRRLSTPTLPGCCCCCSHCCVFVLIITCDVCNSMGRAGSAGFVMRGGGGGGGERALLPKHGAEKEAEPARPAGGGREGGKEKGPERAGLTGTSACRKMLKMSGMKYIFTHLDRGNGHKHLPFQRMNQFQVCTEVKKPVFTVFNGLKQGLHMDKRAERCALVL